MGRGPGGAGVKVNETERRNMSNQRPVILLDVDGVLNALSHHPRGWDDWRQVNARHISIRYSPQMLARLQALDADIVWHTTWRDAANEELAPVIGWDPLPVVPCDGWLWMEPGWWKAPSARAFIEADPRPFVWIDDDLGSADPGEITWVQDYDYLLVQPTWEEGLQPASLTVIEDWVARRSTEVAA